MKNVGHTTLIALGILLLSLVACGGDQLLPDTGAAVEDRDANEDSLTIEAEELLNEDALTVHLQEWRSDCPPVNPNTDNDSDKPSEIYVLKVRVETTSLWTSVAVAGLDSMTAQYAIVQGDEEINVQLDGVEIYEISRPEDGISVGQNIVVEIDVIVQKQSDTAVFQMNQERSGMTVYTLSHDDGNDINEIARFTNDPSDESHGCCQRKFTLELDTLPPPISSSTEQQYIGPLFDAHVHLVGSRDIKHTHADDDRLHINSETADDIFSTLEEENIIGLIGFLPVYHEYFVNDDSFNHRHMSHSYKDEILAVLNRADNRIIPFIHPSSYIGIPSNEHGNNLLGFIKKNLEKTDIPFRGIGEIHTSYPQTDSYHEMRLIDPVMLDLYDYAAAKNLIMMIHPELDDIEDLHHALDHNPNTIFLIHGIIDSGGGGRPIKKHLDLLFQ